MAEQMNNKSLKVGNAKRRLIIAGLVVLGVAIGLFFVWRHQRNVADNQGAASVASAPQIQSLPGAGNASNQYVKDQNLQNKQEEIAARQKGSSAVPTITRPTFAGSMNAFGELPNQSSSSSAAASDPINKVVVEYRSGGSPGASCGALKLEGYSAGELKGVGFDVGQLKQCGYSLSSLAKAGFSAAALKAAGYTAAQLKNAGFTAGQLAAAGYTPQQIRDAGFTKAQLAAAGITNQANECSASALRKDKAEGISASSLKSCGVKSLKAAGYTAGELKQAGFTNAELRKAGFLPAGIAAANRKAAVCSVANIKKERANGFSALQIKNQGCTLSSLKAAGYTAGELQAAGFTAKQLRAAGYTAKQLKDAGYTAAQLKNAGFSAAALKNAGFTANQLKNAGYTAGQLRKAGFTANQLKNAGFTAKQLRAAGFSAGQLKNAGFTASQLKNAGFNAGQLKDAGFSADQLKNAGFTAKQLRAAGYSAKQLKKAGFSAKQLRAAGYNQGQLIRAGFTPKQAADIVTQPVRQIVVQKKEDPAIRFAQAANSANDPQAKLASIERLQQQQMSQQQLQDAIQQQQGAMTVEAQKLLSGWSNNTIQTHQVAVVQPKASISTATAGANGSKNAGPTGPVVKAGSVMFGVLITSINSDENTPIMAKIVTGPLKGSKLLGNFVRVNTKLLIKFDRLNVPGLTDTVAINAVAIDPNTARTAVSGSVNHHYLLRYGTLFASAFLSGISDSILQNGQSTHCLVGSFLCSTTHKNLNTGQQVAVGLGTVGQRYSEEMGQNFQVPPTVKVAGGTGVGVLLMSDLHLPKLPKENASLLQN